MFDLFNNLGENMNTLLDTQSALNNISLHIQKYTETRSSKEIDFLDKYLDYLANIVKMTFDKNKETKAIKKSLKGINIALANKMKALFPAKNNASPIQVVAVAEQLISDNNHINKLNQLIKLYMQNKEQSTLSSINRYINNLQLNNYRFKSDNADLTELINDLKCIDRDLGKSMERLISKKRSNPYSQREAFRQAGVEDDDFDNFTSMRLIDKDKAYSAKADLLAQFESGSEVIPKGGIEKGADDQVAISKLEETEPGRESNSNDAFLLDVFQLLIQIINKTEGDAIALEFTSAIFHLTMEEQGRFFLERISNISAISDKPQVLEQIQREFLNGGLSGTWTINALTDALKDLESEKDEIQEALSDEALKELESEKGEIAICIPLCIDREDESFDKHSVDKMIEDMMNDPLARYEDVPKALRNQSETCLFLYEKIVVLLHEINPEAKEQLHAEIEKPQIDLSGLFIHFIEQIAKTNEYLQGNLDLISASMDSEEGKKLVLEILDQLLPT